MLSEFFIFLFFFLKDEWVVETSCRNVETEKCGWYPTGNQSYWHVTLKWTIHVGRGEEVGEHFAVLFFKKSIYHESKNTTFIKLNL